MKLIRFEKWFFDILTEKKEYIILYYTCMEFLGFRILYMDIDMGQFIEADNDPPFHKYNSKLKVLERDGNTFHTDRGKISIDQDHSTLILSHPGKDIHLHIKPEKPSDEEPAGLIIGKINRQYLKWKTVYLKCLVTGKIIIGKNERVLKDIGYADYVISTFNPMKVPVRTLYWGRLYMDQLDLSFSYAEGKDKTQKWHVMIMHKAGKTIQMNQMLLKEIKSIFYEDLDFAIPDSYLVEAWDDSLQLKLSIHHHYPAIKSSFIDNPEKLGRIGRRILKKISRNPRGIKFFSSAQLEITDKDKKEVLQCPLMIDEFVVFS